MRIEESRDNIFMNMPKGIVELANERTIEEVVKRNGRMIVTQSNLDSKRDFEIAKEYVQKYNPDKLNREKYRAAYEKGELPWQNENTAGSLFVNKDIKEGFHRL